MAFDPSLLGLERRTAEFRVNTVRLAQFAAAINDTNQHHLSGEVAFPTFATVLPMQATGEVLAKVTAHKRLHGEHDIQFYKPIRPGARLFSRADLYSVRPTRAGVTIVIHTRTMASDGELYNEQYNTTLIPGMKISRAYGATAPEHSLHESVRTSTPLTIQRFAMDEDQTRRYSEASRDYSAYTMRLGAAREMGFDGLLVHGLLTLSFACRAIVQHACAEDSTLLRRLACRFTAPVILTAGQSVTTKIWKLTKKSDREAVGFESTDTSGAVVVGHGRAELQS